LRLNIDDQHQNGTQIKMKMKRETQEKFLFLALRSIRLSEESKNKIIFFADSIQFLEKKG
jgi:hypothetical protein